MKIIKTPEEIISELLNSLFEPFSVKSLRDTLSGNGFNFSSKIIQDVIYREPDIIDLEGGFFITYEGAFTGRIFSALLSPAEISQGVFVPGDRCVPFGIADIPSDAYKFYVGGEVVPAKTGVFDSDDAIDMFMLYGEEYATQFITEDPANIPLKLYENDYELPNEIPLTGLDLSFIAEKSRCPNISRLYLRVLDWQTGEFELYASGKMSSTPFGSEKVNSRMKWFGILENALLGHFDKDGPMNSIEEQLVYVFYENSDELCVPYCGSIKEYLLGMSKRIGFQDYGLETRLWRKGEDVPFFGSWNEEMIEFYKSLKDVVSYEDYVLNSIPWYAYEQILTNFLYINSDGLEGFKSYIADILKSLQCTVDDGQVKKISKDIMNDFKNVPEKYNKFRDGACGKIRKRAVNLFLNVSSLTYRINYALKDVTNLPQQNLIILYQLYSHSLSLLKEFRELSSADKETLSIVSYSISGMREFFSMINGALEGALEESIMGKFKIVKVSPNPDESPGEKNNKDKQKE